jgi:hypothetical protein
VNTALKGKRFQDVEVIKENMTAELNALLLEAFAQCFQKLFKPLFLLLVGWDF